jgi:hypothetical protein
MELVHGVAIELVQIKTLKDVSSPTKLHRGVEVIGH